MNGITEKISAYLFVVLTITAACAGIYRLMKIQIVEGDGYLEKSLTVTVQTQPIDVPRGEITDITGKPLVSNKSCFNVITDKAFFPSDNTERNRIILETARIIQKSGGGWNDILPMSGNLPFTLSEALEDDVAKMRKHIGVQIYASPDECLNAMCDNYGISDSYSIIERRVIAGIRYTMDMQNFSFSNIYTFAEDVSMETVIQIKEASFKLDGIDIIEAAVRTYGDGDVIPHLIGTVGAINAEEYAELKERGYALNDTVGKSGIELAMESYLRGKRGVRTIEMQGGQAISDRVTEDAVPGNTVKLTVDSGYQRNIQTILENHIAWLQNQTAADAEGTNADAGAIVVLNAKTGALLAAATAPTYNLNDYINSYSEVVSRPNSPLTNRAVNGLYRPGSTFKPITAAAALNEGVINSGTGIRCAGTYNYWEDYKPKCTGFHGTINVVTALKESCNIFFYDTGRIMGIDTIRKYAGYFGLGGEAGLETGRGITKGHIACPETYEKYGLDWQAGNIVMAAIGQAETAVTPLQMAAAAMTIANKGARYRTYMVDSVYSYTMDEMILKTQPVITYQIPDKSGSTFELITEGMKQAAAFTEYNYPKPREKDYYTGKYVLSDLPYKAAIKTGTPQMTSEKDTGSAFIGFYPADDPQIAFAGFIEHGEYSKFMIRQIIEAYYDSGYTVKKLDCGYEPKDHSPVTETAASETTVTVSEYTPAYTETYYRETERVYETEPEVTETVSEIMSEISAEEFSESAYDTAETETETEEEEYTETYTEDPAVPVIETEDTAVTYETEAEILSEFPETEATIAAPYEEETEYEIIEEDIYSTYGSVE